MKKVTTLLSTLALATTLAAQNLPQTERQYLSGYGCDDMGLLLYQRTQFRQMDENWRTFLLGIARLRHLSVWDHFLWKTIS